MDKKEIRRFVEEHRLAFLSFFSVTLLLLYQHSTGWSWDFGVYSMNGQYFLHEGIYVEWLRPPLASFVLGTLQFFFTRRVSEYILILISSSIFFYAAFKLSERLEVDFDTLYILLLTPAAIAFATAIGTEMLSLAFVMLFLADFEKSRSGLWLGLAFLTRYTMAIFVPLALLQKRTKNKVTALSVSALPVLLWLAYNYVETGDPFTSFANFLALNTVFRELTTPASPEHFILISLPTLLFLFGYYKDSLRDKIDFDDRYRYFLYGTALLVSLLYFKTDPNQLRYLYPLLLPLAVFATPLASEIVEKYGEKTLLILAAVNIILGGIAITEMSLSSPETYKDAAETAQGCMTEADQWVLLNYAGTPTMPQTSKDTSISRLHEGYNTIYFGELFEKVPDGVTKIDKGAYNLYTVSGVCKPPETVTQTFIEEENAKLGLNLTPTRFMLNLLSGDYT